MTTDKDKPKSDIAKLKIDINKFNTKPISIDLTNITVVEYQKLCLRTAGEKSPESILNWGLGITGEAGDVASCIKKSYFHKNDQTLGIKENLGDTLWYVAMICNHFGWNMQDIMKENIEKLAKRYPNGFTFKDAQRNGTMID